MRRPLSQRAVITREERGKDLRFSASLRRASYHFGFLKRYKN
jgi:hypothetical protein